MVNKRFYDYIYEKEISILSKALRPAYYRLYKNSCFKRKTNVTRVEYMPPNMDVSFYTGGPMNVKLNTDTGSLIAVFAN